MSRRIHVSQVLVEGPVDLDPQQAHHARNVLRLNPGDTIEAFDDAGNVAPGVIVRCDADHVRVRIERVERKTIAKQITIASAVPKGDRADWMIEKLSELGVQRFVPLQTARSVVHPKGAKLERWRRIATESAKQSRRVGVMRIDELTGLDEALKELPTARGASGAIAMFLSTAPDAAPILASSSFDLPRSSLSVFIGPEGGWTGEETALLASQGLTGVKLTATILRVETAAVAAAVVAAIGAPGIRARPAAEPGSIGSGSSAT